MTGEQFRALVLSDQNAENPERCIIQVPWHRIARAKADRAGEGSPDHSAENPSSANRAKSNADGHRRVQDCALKRGIVFDLTAAGGAGAGEDG
eukprot:3738539-Rhodomonas_salina.1